jgi:hypothetical protein
LKHLRDPFLPGLPAVNALNKIAMDLQADGQGDGPKRLRIILQRLRGYFCNGCRTYAFNIYSEIHKKSFYKSFQYLDIFHGFSVIDSRYYTMTCHVLKHYIVQLLRAEGAGEAAEKEAREEAEYALVTHQLMFQ